MGYIEYMKKKPLYDSDHPYYCSEENYYASGQATKYSPMEYASWADFKAEWEEADDDLNLLIRWDWAPYLEDGEQRGEGVQNVHVYWVLQRKGIFQCSVFPAKIEEEPEIRIFLERKWNKLKELWAPISD